MRTGGKVVLVFLVAAILAGGSGNAVAASGGPAVLVELFTSQGCSSCPPADRLLRSIEKDDAFRGLVVPLAFHVDYWNRLGWRDPFSSHAWSARQYAYSKVWGVDRVYTPQLVVAGSTDVVGSDAGAVRHAIDAALERRPPVRLAATAHLGSGRINVKTKVDLAAKFSDRPLDLMVAVFENGFTTRIARGENGGRTLQNDFVVRRLEKVATVPASAGVSTHDVTIALDPAWKRGQLGVAVFLQDPSTLRVFGATATHVK